VKRRIDLYIAAQQCCRNIRYKGLGSSRKVTPCSRKIRPRHRLHLRHRARGRARLRQGGANLTINGFGDKAAIEKERAGIEKEFGVKAIYSGADMTKPAEIAEMIAATGRPSARSTCW
jgi:hypothetical protein